MKANKIYTEEILSKQYNLTLEDEKELAQNIKQGDIKAIETLIKANQKFVISIANKYRNKGIEIDDLISEGNIGMIQAAKNFDETKNTRFVNFAAKYIKQAIEKAIKEQNIAINETNQKDLILKSKTISIDQSLPIGKNNGFTLQSVIENNNSPHADAHLTQQLLHNKIKDGIKVLNEREQTVIVYLYGLKGDKPMTMAEVGNMLKLKRERIRQIRNKAIRKLHKKLK